MRIRIPSKRIRERFLIVYELEGCQKAMDLLTEYYEVRRKNEIKGGRVSNRGIAICFDRTPFTPC